MAPGRSRGGAALDKTDVELRIETPVGRDYSSKASLLLSGGPSMKTYTRRVYKSLCHRAQHLDGPPVLAGCGGRDDRATSVLALAVPSRCCAADDQ